MPTPDAPDFAQPLAALAVQNPVTVSSTVMVSGVVPAGAVIPYAAATSPSSDWLLCDGSTVSRTTYATLYAAIGTTYGAGDGTSTFVIPDLRGRIPAGYAASGGHTDVAALGNTDGTALAARRPKHKTSVTDAGHTHAERVWTGGTGGTVAVQSVGSDNGVQNANSVYNTGSSTTGVTAGPQTGSEPTDAPAYIVLNYLIKT